MKTISFAFLLFFALSTQAQDFQKFINSAQMRTQFMPPYSFDSTYWANCETQMRTSKLKRIAHNWVEKFIISNSQDSAKFAQLIHNSGGESLAAVGIYLPDMKKYAQSTATSFYFLERIELTPNFTNLLVYYSNEPDKKESGNVHKAVLLLSHDKEGNLVSAIKVINYQTFVDVRIHTTTIDGNYTVTQKETSYLPAEQKKYTTGKEKYDIHFRRFEHFKLDVSNGTYTSAKKTFYPYAGAFKAENAENFLIVDQGHEFLYVHDMELESYDIKKGTFKGTVTATEEVWTGVFSQDKNTLTITKPAGKVIYRRVEE